MSELKESGRCSGGRNLVMPFKVQGCSKFVDLVACVAHFLEHTGQLPLGLVLALVTADGLQLQHQVPQLQRPAAGQT